MAFLEVYKSFIPEDIEDQWPLDEDHFFRAAVRNLWYLFLDPIMRSSERLTRINPNFLRLLFRFVAAENTLEYPTNETTYDILLRKICVRRVTITRDIVHEEYAFFLRDLGFIFQETQQEILSAHSRRALNEVCRNTLENVDKLHSRFHDTLRLLSEWPNRCRCPNCFY